MAFVDVEYGMGGGTKVDKLWQNPSPNSTFPPQSINSSSSGWVSGMSLQNYDYILIVSKNHTSYGSESNPQIATLISKNSSMHNGLVGTYDDKNILRIRTCTINSSTNSIIFEDGYYHLGTSSVDNNSAIPLYILGIKSLDGLNDYLNI